MVLSSSFRVYGLVMYALRFLKMKEVSHFVSSASLSSVNKAGFPVLFLSATGRNSRQRAINLVMTELLGTSTFRYFTRKSLKIRTYERLLNYCSTIKTLCSWDNVINNPTINSKILLEAWDKTPKIASRFVIIDNNWVVDTLQNNALQNKSYVSLL